MSLFGRIEQRASAVPQLWASSEDGWEKAFPDAFSPTQTGKNVSEQGSLRMVAVWACVSLIADGVSSLPVDEIVEGPDGLRNPAESPPRWISQPNPYQTRQDFWHRVVTSLCLNGNSFIYVGRNGSGQIESLYALDPRSVYIQDIGNGNAIYHVGDAKLTSKEIVHIPAFTVPGMVRGLSPIDAAREAVGLGLTAEEFGARFFSQGTAMAGVIEHPGNPKPGEAKMLRQMFRKTHAGVKNSHAVGVLTGGAQFKPITMSPESAQFLETRKFQRHEIALLYRVPAYMVDPTTTSTWGAGIEEQNKWFVTQTLGPWITRIEQAVSTFLLPRRRSFKFNIDARMRPNTSDRFTAYEKAINAGIMSPDEARALEDMPPIPDGRGETFWRPSYTATIEALQDKMFAEQNQTTGENGNGK